MATIRRGRFAIVSSTPPDYGSINPIANCGIVTGKMQSPVPLYLTSLQIPYQPIMDALFDEVDTPSEDFYGALFSENITYHDFPVNLPLPIIQSFEFGTHQGDHAGREFRVFGVNNDNSEELLVTYNAAGTYTLSTPKVYKRLKYSVRSNAKPNFIKVFATHQPYTLPQVVYTKYPLGNHMGTNIHPYSILENPNNSNEREHIFPSALAACVKMGRVRCYVDNMNISITEDEYQFDSDRQGYAIDHMMQELHDAGVYVVWCMQALTIWMNATYPDQNNYERVPVLYGADRLNPASWAVYGEIAFQVALRYGSNSSASTSLSKSREGEMWPGSPPEYQFVKRIGLGYLTEIEPYNEIDKWWKGLESYASGHEMAIAMNVIYQRIKDADPNMKVTYPGLASFSPEVLKEFVYWSIKLYNRIPVDNYAYHAYPSTTGGQYTGNDSVGAMPELWSYPATLQRFRTAMRVRLGNKPFDCGETGFDSTQFSPLRAVVPTGSTYTQRQWAAIMYARTAIFHAKNGVRATYHYQWSDNNISDQYTQFAAMGMTTPTGSAPNIVHTPYPNLYLLGQIRDIAGDYKHDNQLSSSPLVDKWVKEGGLPIYTAYSPTENNSSANYNLALPDDTIVEIVEFSFNSYSPTVTEHTVTGGYITIACTETPKFIRVIGAEEGDADAIILNTFDNVFFFNNAKNEANTQATDKQFVKTIPSSKGGLTLTTAQLPYTDTTVTAAYPSGYNKARPQTETLKYNKGWVLLDNEKDFYFVTEPTTVSIPSEDWFVAVDLCGFTFEAYMNIYGKYLADYGGSFRSTNGDDQLFPNSALGLYKPVVVRMQYTASRTLKLWINGVYKGERNTYLTGTSNFFTRTGIGTDTNNAKIFVGSLVQVNRALSDLEASAALDAFTTKYGIGQDLPYPIIKSVDVSFNSSTVSAVGTYYSPTGVAENTSLRKYRWYGAGIYSGAPDVTFNTRITALDNLSSWSKATYSAILAQHTWFRVDIECTDVNGLTFSAGSGSDYIIVV